jgi:hypothetical protein
MNIHVYRGNGKYRRRYDVDKITTPQIPDPANTIAKSCGKKGAKAVSNICGLSV